MGRHDDLVDSAMRELEAIRAEKQRTAALMASREELAAVRAEVALTAQVVLALATFFGGRNGPAEVEAEASRLLTLRARQAELEKAVQP